MGYKVILGVLGFKKRKGLKVIIFRVYDGKM